MPTGPISVIGIKRTLQKGRLSGFLSDLGSISADMIYATAAALSLTQIHSLIYQYHIALRTLTACFLIVLGIKTVLWQHNTNFSLKRTYSLFGDYISTFIFTITNPIAILFFPTLFATFKLIWVNNYFLIFTFLSGILIGSILWSFIFCNIIFYFRQKILQIIPAISKIFGYILVLIGVIILISLLLKR